MTEIKQTPETTAENVAQTMRDVMEELGHVDALTPHDTNPFTEARLVATPEKRLVKDITGDLRAAAEYPKPARRRGTARLADLASLIAWANRFKGSASALFANPDPTSPSLLCIADYHEQGAPDPLNPQGDPTARHMGHRATYAFPLSDEWKAWMEVSKGQGGSPVPLGNDELGEFIEASAKDIMDPTPAILASKVSDRNEPWENRLIETARQIEGRYGQLAQLLAMSKRFQVFEQSDLKVSTNRDTGEAEIQFLNEHKDAAGKPLNIPNLIIIAIPVFQGGALYRMPVRFRYRKRGAEVRFLLSAYNPEKAFEAAFREAINQASAETELPLFLGQPETI